MELVVFSRRQGHDDTYQVEKTGTGWRISFLSIGGECDKSGAPFLYSNLDQDSIKYPKSLPDYMELLWQDAYDQKLTDDQIQDKLDQLGAWIQITEKNSPDW